MSALSGVKTELIDGSEHLFTDVWFIVPNWNWIAIAAILVLGFLLSKVLKWSLNVARKRIERKFSTREMAGLFFQRPIHRPLARIIATSAMHAAMVEIHLPTLLEKIFIIPIKAWGGYNAIVLCYLGVDAVGQLLEIVAQRTENTLDDHLAPMATKVMKVFVVGFGILILLQSFGVPVVSVLAGLSLGGLALALAAQDTAANLFGSVMIIVDRPFQVGDWIKFTDVEGRVEEVGLRSTRLRTAATSVITIPNALMAKEKIDNIGARVSRRALHTFLVAYDSDLKNLQAYMDRLRKFLAQHPKIAKQDAYVTTPQMTDTGLRMQVSFYMQVNSQDEENQTQEAVLFEIIRLAAEMKINFPTMTQNLNIKSLPENYRSATREAQA